MIQVRSGDIFTHWKDGARAASAHHSGYESGMGDRGQPPLAFYTAAMAHAATTADAAKCVPQFGVCTAAGSQCCDVGFSCYTKHAHYRQCRRSCPQPGEGGVWNGDGKPWECHSRPGLDDERKAYSRATVVTSPDQANPVVPALAQASAQHSTFVQTHLPPACCKPPRSRPAPRAPQRSHPRLGLPALPHASFHASDVFPLMPRHPLCPACTAGSGCLAWTAAAFGGGAELRLLPRRPVADALRVAPRRRRLLALLPRRSPARQPAAPRHLLILRQGELAESVGRIRN